MTLNFIPPSGWLVASLFVAALGACIGSFLNVCIYRIPREESIVRPRSHCPACGKLIPWFLNLPVLSYLMLRGRCRFCGASITFRYVLVELLTALLFLLVWMKFVPIGPPRLLGLAPMDDPRLLPVYGLAVGGLILGSFVDCEHLIIPDRVTLGGIVAGLVLSPLVPSMHVDTGVWYHALLQSVIGAAAGWGLLWSVAALGSFIFRKEAMGFGDVKLMGAIGAFFGWRAVIFTVMVSSLLGSLAGLGLIVSGRGRLQSRIPYGPYLALAALIWLFWGPTLWQGYISLLMPAAP